MEIESIITRLVLFGNIAQAGFVVGIIGLTGTLIYKYLHKSTKVWAKIGWTGFAIMAAGMILVLITTQSIYSLTTSP
jgi:hypothetical protein